MKWTDAEDIGIALFEKFPGVDPLTIRFTDLRERVLALDDFDDDPKASNEPKLEAIQMAWYEEFKDAQMSVREMFRPGMRAYIIPLVAGVALAVSAFLPWVIVGEVTLTGVPEVRGAVDRRPRHPRRRSRHAEPHHPQEFPSPAAAHRSRVARPDVSVVANSCRRRSPNAR